jgi:hypothetical protein
MRSRKLTRRIVRVGVGIALIGASLAVSAPAAHAAGDTISIGDVSIIEGDIKNRAVSLPVTLSNPHNSQVSVNWTLVPVTAAPGKTEDYYPKSGTVTFKVRANGETAVKGQVNVVLFPDIEIEGDETLEVHLSSPTAPYTFAKSVGTITIVDDDTESPGVRAAVSDVTVHEGDLRDNLAPSGRAIQFRVTLNQPATSQVNIDWTVVNDTATCALVKYGAPTTPGQDCSKPNGVKTLVFKVGGNGLTPVSKAVTVHVFGDATVESDEAFEVTLSNITGGGGATLQKAVGVGTIVNDD